MPRGPRDAPVKGRMLGVIFRSGRAIGLGHVRRSRSKVDIRNRRRTLMLPPRRIAGDRARAPRPDATVAHVPDAVDPRGFKKSCSAREMGVLETERAANDLVPGALCTRARVAAA